MEQEANFEKFLPKIKNVQILHWLHEEELRKLLLISSLLHFKKGETVISQGEVGDALYAVIKGKVHVSVKDIKDKEITICSIGPGEIFGEAAIFMATKRTATVTCVKDTTVMQITRRNLIFFFKTHPHAGNKLLMLIVLNLLNKLRHANEDLVLEKQSDIDLEYVDNLIQDFISETDADASDAA